MSRQDVNLAWANLAWLETVHARERDDEIRQAWEEQFAALGVDGSPPAPRGPSFEPPRLFDPRSGADRPRETSQADSLQHAVDALVASHRRRGHEAAELDPLGTEPPTIDELSLHYHGLSDEHLERRFYSDVGEPGVAKLRAIIDRLERAYGGTVSAQLAHIRDGAVRSWMQRRIERLPDAPPLDEEDRRRILSRLVEARVFDELIQKRYLGSKTFSAEGAHALLPMITATLEEGAHHGLREAVLAMTHRGRLNVLCNIVGRPAWLIFRAFEDDNPGHFEGRGDVAYHLGASGEFDTPEGPVHVSLCFNPSHLETVDAVALGRTRAKQERSGDDQREAVMAIVVHGDAGFAGEGAVQESLNLSRLPAYETGGAIHIVVDNQLGFTTGPEAGRSTTSASDVARMIDAPLLYVNGGDAEAAVRVMKLATEYRARFHRDVVVELRCFRRQGHNELDEPAFTQPKMYDRIEETPDLQGRYAKQLSKAEVIAEEDVEAMAQEVKDHLEEALDKAKSSREVPEPPAQGGIWTDYRGGPDKSVTEVDTGVPADELTELLERLSEVPEGFQRHKKLQGFAERRGEMIEGERPLDWSAGEALAFATLAVEGAPVRLTGQDSERGTFGHRHAVLHDVETGETHARFMHLADDQAPVRIANSPLCELGVLGFEYGYSLSRPEALVCWEAQFGDFANMAQAIIDQYVVSAEDKWRRLSGLVLLLPHGFEGKGPEHSSARLSRFLEMAAEDNIQITQPTTPAQIFHLLRRQVRRPWRKPLVVMSPKSLLRHGEAVSRLEELAEGRFQRVLADPDRPKETGRLLLCSGKIYYELAKRRAELERSDVEIVRLEQLYPLSDDELAGALAHLPDDTPCTWVQEEPENMGAWRWLQHRFGDRILGRFPLRGVYRAASASPATGAKSAHLREQKHLLDRAFGADRE